MNEEQVLNLIMAGFEDELEKNAGLMRVMRLMNAFAKAKRPAAGLTEATAMAAGKFGRRVAAKPQMLKNPKAWPAIKAIEGPGRLATEAHPRLTKVIKDRMQSTGVREAIKNFEKSQSLARKQNVTYGLGRLGRTERIVKRPSRVPLQGLLKGVEV